MHLLADYVQPITIFLKIHPYLALLVTFIAAFTESLAIIGSIIPGSVTMTALGILAGSGIMRIDLTLLAATLGATAGDSASYLLGYNYSEKLNQVWPFCRYPEWLDYGKQYFVHHGGKSVLIGRFFGPLRSIIPVIAGMMHMQHWRFFSANIISAVGWAFLYVLPGVLIGKASNELPTAHAGRLFAFVLIVLGALWLLITLAKWLLVHINYWLKRQIYSFYSWSHHHPLLSPALIQLSGFREKKYLSTLILLIIFLTSLTIFSLITYLVATQTLTTTINLPVYYLFQSIRIRPLEIFFIGFGAFIGYVNIATIMLFFVVTTVIARDLRTTGYWISLNLSMLAIALIFQCFMANSAIDGLLPTHYLNTYPAPKLLFTTVYCTIFLCFLVPRASQRLTSFLYASFISMLILAGLSLLYLGDQWLLNCLGAYTGGLCLALGHWLCYRRYLINYRPGAITLYLLITLLILSTLSTFFLSYKQVLHAHRLNFAEYMLSEKQWWQQETPLLPEYRTNRFGRRIAIFNLQYSGQLMHLQQSLAKHGWDNHNTSFFISLIKRIDGSPATTPLITPLYLNNKPVLVMTYTPVKHKLNLTLILQLWRSNYHLHTVHQPIWLGSLSLTSNTTFKKNSDVQQVASGIDSAWSNVIDALPEFAEREIPLNINTLNQKGQKITPSTLLLIKELR